MSIRITELDAITSLQNGDYIAVDNESTGTHKFDALNIGANIGQNIANTYSSSASYAIGQYCLYDNNLYKCTTTISTPEAWNSSHWIQVTVGEGLYEKVDKVSGKGLSTNDFTDEYKQKLGGIEAGAEVNVQANWAETNTSSDSYIQNKPGNATTETSGFMSASDKQKLNGIANGAEVNVQADWAETDSSKDDYIKNKPTIDDTLSTSSTNAVENSAIATAINNVTQLVSDEATARENAISGEATARENAISGEATARENADIAINEDIGEINTTLETKANIDGSYQEMTVGSAEQLLTDVTTENNKIYTFRTTGGSIDVGDRKTEQLVGGTVAWNQLIENVASKWAKALSGDTIAYDTTTRTVSFGGVAQNSRVKYFPIVTSQNHIYIASAIVSSDSNGTMKFEISRGYVNATVPVTTTPTRQAVILKPTSNTDSLNAIQFFKVVSGNVSYALTIKELIVTDLTQMFGSTVADAIYAMEQAEAGTGVAWFKNYFPKSYYAYDAGSLQSVNIASGVNTGFNQWDEEWENGEYSITTGAKITGSNGVRCKNLIPIIGGANYNFTCLSKTSANAAGWCWYDANGDYISGNANVNVSLVAPSNAKYLSFFVPSTWYGTTYNHDICINIRWDGERDGEYEPYDAHIYNYDSSLQLRGIPSLDEFNNLVYDGDVYSSDGTVQRKYGIVDLGTLDWIKGNRNTADTGWTYYSYGIQDYVKSGAQLISMLTVNPNYNSSWESLALNEIRMGSLIAKSVIACGTSEDATAFKTAMNGVYLVYELATPTTEEADPYQNPQIINDWGTEEWVDAYNGRDFLIPPGHNTQYMINLKAKLEMSPNSPDGDGEYIVRQTDSMNEYIPFSWAGEHEDLIAGGAQQLISDIYEENSEPYLFRTSGGSIEIGDREYMDAVVGGTVAWNQLLQNGNFESTSNWTKYQGDYSVTNNEATITSSSDDVGLIFQDVQTIIGHKYLALVTAKCGTASEFDLYLQKYLLSPIKTITSTSYTEMALIAEGDRAYIRMQLRAHGNGKTAIVKNAMCIDLTLMFGSTIADYIYSLEQANAGAGVAWFKKLFPKPYYAYNAGELKSVSGLVSHDMTGFNQWDEEWESGSNRILSKNFIPVLPNTAYCLSIGAQASDGFYLYPTWYDSEKNSLGQAIMVSAPYAVRTSPADARYMGFYMWKSGWTNFDNHPTICINLSWDGSEDGNYEPYQKWSYPLDSDLELRGIPKIENGKLYYDGDTYGADGSISRKYGIVTLDGSNDEVWNTQTALPNAFSYVDSSIKDGLGQASVHVLSNYLEGKTQDEMASPASPYGVAQFAWGTQLVVRIPNITSLTDLKAYLANNPLQVVYELATPTTETADPYTSPQIVNDFGTEEFVIDSEIAVPIPVGHNTRYTANLKAKLEMAPDSPNGDGDYIVRQSNGVNTYVPLVIEDALPATPTTNGTYRLIATVTDGEVVLSWGSNT